MNLLSPALRAERQHRRGWRGAWIGRAAALFTASLLGASLASGAQAGGVTDYDLLLQGAWWADRSFADDLLSGDCTAVQPDGDERCSFLRFGGRILNRNAGQGRGEIEEDAAGFSAGFRMPRNEGQTISFGMAYETSDGELDLQGGATGWNGEATGQRLILGVASSTRWNSWDLGYAFDIGYARHDVRRAAAADPRPAVDPRSESNPRVVLAGGHMKAGRRYGLPGFAGLKSVEFRPSLHSSVLYLKAQRMGERGGQNPFVQVNDVEEIYLVLRPSVELRGAAPDLGNLTLQPYLQLGFAWFATGAESDFTARNAAGNRQTGTGKFDSILAEGAFGLRIQGDQTALGLGYEGSFGGDSSSHRAMLRMELAF